MHEGRNLDSADAANEGRVESKLLLDCEAVDVVAEREGRGELLAVPSCHCQQSRLQSIAPPAPPPRLR